MRKTATVTYHKGLNELSRPPFFAFTWTITNPPREWTVTTHNPVHLRAQVFSPSSKGNWGAGVWWQWQWTLRPLATVEGERMRRLLLYPEPGCHLPSHKYVSTKLNAFEFVCWKLSKVPKRAMCICLTSTINVYSFISNWSVCPSNMADKIWNILSDILCKWPTVNQNIFVVVLFSQPCKSKYQK